MIETAIKIQPFTVLAGCPKCGAGQPPSAMSVSTMSIHPVAFIGEMRTRYCSGGKEPEAEPDQSSPLAITDAFHKIVSSLPGAGEALGSSLPRSFNICAGITQEHLHRTCSNCQYEFLMATKDTEV